MSVSFDNLKVLAIPQLNSCPNQIIEQRLYTMAKRFFNRSEVWILTQNQAVVANQLAYVLSLPTGYTNAEAKRLRGVWYGEDAADKADSDLVDTERYELDRSRAYVLMAGTASPDITGRYYYNGASYNSEKVYEFGSTPYFIWNDGSNWILSTAVGTKTNYYSAATLTATWTAAGTYTGAPTSTNGDDLAVYLYTPWTSAITSGLTTELVLTPDIANHEVPGEYMDDWGIRGILEGTLMSLKRDRNQPWEDRDGAKEHEREWLRSIAEAKRIPFNKRKSGDLRVTPRWFA